MQADKILLFDFDGVIVDSFETCFGVATEFHPGLTRDHYRGMFHGNIFENKEVRRNYDGEVLDVEKDKLHTDLYKLLEERILGLKPIKGIDAVLNALTTDHLLYVMTSNINSTTKNYLNKHGLGHHFSDIYGADTHKSKVKKMQMIFDKHETGPESCLFITDTLGDLREAAKLNVPGLAVSWGFHDRDTLLQGNPKHIVNSPTELTEIIQDHFEF